MLRLDRADVPGPLGKKPQVAKMLQDDEDRPGVLRHGYFPRKLSLSQNADRREAFKPQWSNPKRGRSKVVVEAMRQSGTSRTRCLAPTSQTSRNELLRVTDCANLNGTTQPLRTNTGGNRILPVISGVRSHYFVRTSPKVDDGESRISDQHPLFWTTMEMSKARNARVNTLLAAD
ncbi:MAG: hypothetical protein M1837_007411 [Sclerophora amabilis]|nr:MAG: hypothetical protein M1837_007411 [Sclerophora amabilis]